MLADSILALSATPSKFEFAVLLAFAAAMLIWDTVEVGRNDAANLVNSVYGARLMTRKTAARIAGAATVVGAMLASGVIETARQGIFAPAMLTPEEAAAIYVSVYVVDTVLLYGYSAYGMPVSTTASLVFELLGASLAISLIRNYTNVVQWGKASTVIAAIIVSIFLAGFASFVVQRLVRGVIRDRATDLRTMRLHGTWIGGGMATGLVFFLILKGAKKAPPVEWVRSQIDAFNNWLNGGTWHDPKLFAEPLDAASAAGAQIVQGGTNLGMAISVFALWIFFGVLIAALLRKYRERAARQIFPVLAILGMIAMGIAFGQNDLANCASPGLATITLLRNWDMGTAAATQIPIDWYLLLGCGVLLFLGMRTKNATRVTKAAVRTGSQTDHVGLYAPRWCIAVAQRLVTHRPGDASLAPRARFTERGKRIHFDPLRASVIMCISASVIALASSYKLPVSTTYVTFAAIVGSAMGDRVFEQGDAALKLARAVWVVASWFLAAAIAAVFTGIVCVIIHLLGVFGLAATVAANLFLRRVLRDRGDAQARRTREELMERKHPERFATEYE
jgi:phosphate/sulfate permease